MAANGEPIPRQEAERENDDELERDGPSETTPLLPVGEENADQSQPHHERSAESLLRSITNGGGKGSLRRRWPSLLALLLLCILIVLIMFFAFFAPKIVEQYAAEAVVFEPTSLSIDGFTSSGVTARVQGNFHMRANRVTKASVRNIGRFGTWLVREVESGESHVDVSLPEYGNVVLGTAYLPPIKVDVRNGHTTRIDFLSNLEPGEKDGIRRIANDWIDGRLGQLRVLGKVTVPVKSGIFSLGAQTLNHEITFANQDIPKMPGYEIKKINVHEHSGGMAADASLLLENEYPVDLTVPALGFQILVEDCQKNDPYIMVADAMMKKTHIQPKKEVEVKVTGIVRQLPNLLTHDCPGTDQSPLDVFLGNYMRGEKNTIYVRGAESPDRDTPDWVQDLISDIIVPVPLPGRKSGHLIKNFSLTDTHFNLPDPFADPKAPESNPMISAKVQALVALPEEMNFNISANRVRADAVVYYKGDKLGTLDLDKWQPANSTRIEPTPDEGPGLLVESRVDKAPLNITDEDVFTDLIQELIFGGKRVILDIKADVSVQVETALGEFKVRKIPAQGQVPIKPITKPGHGGKIGSGFKPKISDLHIINTTSSSITFSALVNLTNPTKYSATVPYVDILITKNGSTLGHATARGISVQPGENHNLLLYAVYSPFDLGGDKSAAVGREIISQYISGWNTTITLLTHSGTIPTQPALGDALSKFPIEVPAPRLKPPQPPSTPGDPDRPRDNGTETHFIKDATMHLFGSVATFTLLSPLRYSTLFIETLNATALYKGDDVGRIEYYLPFAVPPVDKDGKGVISPRLPVKWSVGSVGFGAVKDALGGRLKLSANADVDIRLDEFRESVWYQGKSIGASIEI